MGRNSPKAALQDILPFKNNFIDGFLECKFHGDTILIEYGEMYQHPELSFKQLKQLSELFGSDDITYTTYSAAGCETCDFGSSYGYYITVKNPTKNQGLTGRWRVK